jgi:hypothetical protein
MSVLKMLGECRLCAAKERAASFWRRNRRSWKTGMLGSGRAGRAKAKDGPGCKAVVARQINTREAHGFAAPKQGWGQAYLTARWTEKGELSRTEGRKVVEGTIGGLQAESGDEPAERGRPCSQSSVTRTVRVDPSRRIRCKSEVIVVTGWAMLGSSSGSGKAGG